MRSCCARSCPGRSLFRTGTVLVDAGPGTAARVWDTADRCVLKIEYQPSVPARAKKGSRLEAGAVPPLYVEAVLVNPLDQIPSGKGRTAATHPSRSTSQETYRWPTLFL